MGPMFANGHGISAYLHSNDVPSIHDATIIRGLIEQKLSDITRIEHDIWTVEETLKKLNQRKREAEADLELHRGLLCSVRKLPIEILGEIFMFCTSEDCSIWSPPHPLKAPMLFCQVSKSWRIAAISNPLLWSTFGIDVSCRPQSAELTKLWLQRAQKMPLTLGLRVNGEKQDQERIRDLNIALVRDTLIPNFARCRSFTFRCSGEFDDQLLEEIPLSLTHNLEYLDLPLDLPNCPFMFQWCFNLAVASPKLRQLTCGIPSVLVRDGAWEHIEKLDLRFMGLKNSQVGRFLKVAPRLKEFNFGLVTRDSETTSTTTPSTSIVQHDTLRTLKIYDRSESLGALLDDLKLPKLTALTIAGRRRGWPHGSMMGFLERSGCSLRLLDVESTSLLSEDLISYLSINRIRESLEDLRVNKTVPTTKSLLDYMTVKPSKQPIPLPKLRSFLCSIDPVNQAVLYEKLVRSRWNDTPQGAPPSLQSDEASVEIARLKRIYLTIISPVFEGATIETPQLNALLEKVGKDSDVVVTVYRLSNTFDELTSALPPEPPSPPASEYGDDDD